ncbi:uncharacterized protein LOC134229171 isoform X1 [Saccostrea cucullata]|uniref:uncharacterized protein LOC134229171 isoform X1 n=1 Tax=Saccostrea cuccullata TaxID=36930 RepID=UPI002ED0A7BC
MKHVVETLVALCLLCHHVVSVSNSLQCIERATDIYKKITNTTTCLSSYEKNVSLRNITECSEDCVVKETSREDNYMRIHIKYDTDIILKLESKKNYNCGYSSKNMYIECTINKRKQERLETCITGQCINSLNGRTIHSKQVNETDNVTLAPQDANPLSDPLIFSAAIAGSIILSAVITGTGCLLFMK